MQTKEFILLLKTLPQKTLSIQENVSFSALTSFHTGGNCALCVSPRTSASMRDLFLLLKREGIPYLLLGRGTNVLAPDEGYQGVLILTTEQSALFIEENTIHAEAGVTLNALALAAKQASLTSLEFSYGIPGTVGGAIFMNAGAFDGQISDVLESTEVLDETGTAVKLSLSEQQFDYRKSIYQKRPLTVLSAAFRLSPGNRTAIRAKMDHYLAHRKRTQPLEYPSAGSVFKRPEGNFAGGLIEKAGLKGARIGGAMVSEKHAGFIINAGGATTADVKQLIALIQKKVFEHSGIRLECEVRELLP